VKLEESTVQQGMVDVTAILRCGVYVLLREGVVVYVGQSKKMLGRVSAHKSNWGKKTPAWLPASCRGILFDQVWVRPCRVEDLDAVERELINLYKPKYNLQLKTPEPISTPFTIAIGDTTLVVNQPKPRFERRI